MAIGPIVTVLSSIPWNSVIENAPKIADSAARLWNKLANRNPQLAGVEDAQSYGLNAPSQVVSPLDLRIGSLESSVEEVRRELLAATTLIGELARQNTALVERVEWNRVRIQRQMIAIGGVLLISVFTILAIISRS